MPAIKPTILLLFTDRQLRTYPKRELPVNPDACLNYQDQAWANPEIPGYSATKSDLGNATRGKP